MCDPTWHVSSRSGVATLRTAIHLLLVTYLRSLETTSKSPKKSRKHSSRSHRPQHFPFVTSNVDLFFLYTYVSFDRGRTVLALLPTEKGQNVTFEAVDKRAINVSGVVTHRYSTESCTLSSSRRILLRFGGLLQRL